MDYFTPDTGPKPPTEDERSTLALLGLFHCAFGCLGIGGAMLLWINNANDSRLKAVSIFLFAQFLIIFLSGLCMRLKRFRIFSIVLASITCLAFPLGTIIGGWTLVFLCKPGVRALYMSE